MTPIRSRPDAAERFCVLAIFLAALISVRNDVGEAERPRDLRRQRSSPRSAVASHPLVRRRNAAAHQSQPLGRALACRFGLVRCGRIPPAERSTVWFAGNEVESLPVCRAGDDTYIEGLITRQAVMRRYQEELDRQTG